MSVPGTSGLVVNDYTSLLRERFYLNGICLGTHPNLGSIAATDQALYRDAIPPDDALEDLGMALLPGWAEIVVPVADTINATNIRLSGGSGTGLFWAGDYFQQAVRWAIATALAIPGGVDIPRAGAWCGVHSLSVSSWLRLALNEGRVHVTVNEHRADGVRTGVCFPGIVFAEMGGIDVVTHQKTPSLILREHETHMTFESIGGDSSNAQAPLDEGLVVVCGRLRLNASMADYLLWWAWRLTQYGEAYQDRWAIFVATMAFRHAMSHLVRLGSIVIHEVVHHLCGTAGHCFSGVRGLACAHEAVEHSWYHCTLALLGLPDYVDTTLRTNYKADSWGATQTSCGAGGGESESFLLGGYHRGPDGVAYDRRNGLIIKEIVTLRCMLGRAAPPDTAGYSEVHSDPPQCFGPPFEVGQLPV